MPSLVGQVSICAMSPFFLSPFFLSVGALGQYVVPQPLDLGMVTTLGGQGRQILVLEFIVKTAEIRRTGRGATLWAVLVEAEPATLPATVRLSMLALLPVRFGKVLLAALFPELSAVRVPARLIRCKPDGFDVVLLSLFHFSKKLVTLRPNIVGKCAFRIAEFLRSPSATLTYSPM